MNNEPINSDCVGMVQVFHKAEFLHDLELIFIVQSVIYDAIIFDGNIQRPILACIDPSITASSNQTTNLN